MSNFIRIDRLGCDGVAYPEGKGGPLVVNTDLIRCIRPPQLVWDAVQHPDPSEVVVQRIPSLGIAQGNTQIEDVVEILSDTVLLVGHDLDTMVGLVNARRPLPPDPADLTRGFPPNPANGDLVHSHGNTAVVPHGNSEAIPHGNSEARSHQNRT